MRGGINRALIMWMVRRCAVDRLWRTRPMTSWQGRKVARRYEPFRLDEIRRGDGSIYRELPWWFPINGLLHHWLKHDDGPNMHDHPRRSMTLVLKGELIEMTPWGERRLRPGSIVIRGPRYIHGFRVEPEHSARTWTLFIVGRRRHPQNTYQIDRRLA